MGLGSWVLGAVGGRWVYIWDWPLKKIIPKGLGSCRWALGIYLGLAFFGSWVLGVGWAMGIYLRLALVLLGLWALGIYLGLAL